MYIQMAARLFGRGRALNRHRQVVQTERNQSHPHPQTIPGNKKLPAWGEEREALSNVESTASLEGSASMLFTSKGNNFSNGPDT